jgi:biotin carboxylase
VVEAVAAGVAALAVESGPVTARVVLGEDGPLVARLAPRLGGGHDGELCHAALGIDLDALAVRAALGEQPDERDLVPIALAGGACVRFLVAPAGELREVAGLNEAQALPGVRGIWIYRRPGHVFADLHRPSDRAGAVLTVGDDRGQALERADRALELIRFETADVAALV